MSSLVVAYEQLLLDNVGTVRTVESAIRNVTWFLPGRFNDADIASEGLYSLLSVVSSFHDDLLEKHIPPALSLPPHPFAPGAGGPSNQTIVVGDPLSSIPTSAQPRLTPVLPPASEHARYTRYWSDRSKTYRRASRALTTATYIELLLEMVARRRIGDRARWRLVLSVESFKTILRLVIIAITRRPVLYPATPQREFDYSLIPLDRLMPSKDRSTPPAASIDEGAPKRGEGRPVVPILGTRAPLRTHLYPLAASLPDEYLSHPLGLVPELHGVSEYSSEILSSVAILIQVLLLIRQSRNVTFSKYKPTSLPTLSRSFSPFLIPLALQLLARRLRAPSGDSTLLADHYAQLDRRMASRFFLQGPMWIGWTRPKVVSVINFLGRIPLISLAGDLVAGYLPLVDDYFYTVT